VRGATHHHLHVLAEARGVVVSYGLRIAERLQYGVAAEDFVFDACLGVLLDNNRLEIRRRACKLPLLQHLEAVLVVLEQPVLAYAGEAVHAELRRFGLTRSALATDDDGLPLTIVKEVAIRLS
jgi:hypothetical protein